MIKVRLSGSWDEIKQAQKIISNTFDIYSISQPYPDRGQADHWRIYIECGERRGEYESNN